MKMMTKYSYVLLKIYHRNLTKDREKKHRIYLCTPLNTPHQMRQLIFWAAVNCVPGIFYVYVN